MPQLPRSAGRLPIVVGGRAEEENGSGGGSSSPSKRLPSSAQTRTLPKQLLDRLKPSDCHPSKSCARGVDASSGVKGEGSNPELLLLLLQSSTGPACQNLEHQSGTAQVRADVKGRKRLKKRRKSSNDALIWPDPTASHVSDVDGPSLSGAAAAAARTSREAGNEEEEGTRCCAKRRKRTGGDLKESKIERRVEDGNSHPKIRTPHESSAALDTAWSSFLCGEGVINEGVLKTDIADLMGRQLEVTVSREASTIDAWLDSLEEDKWRNGVGGDNVLGLDVEWTPCFVKGAHNPAALLQLSSGTRCLIVQLLHMDRRSQKLVSLFGPYSSLRFAGVGVREDLRKLTADHFMPPCEERGVELGTLAATVLSKPDVRGWGLKALSRAVLSYEMEKPKKVVMSKWGSRVLSVEQVRYASLDAWISYLIWKALDSRPRYPLKQMSQE